MRLNEGSINRCGIFLFYDKDGIVDDYVIYLLEDLKKNVDDLLIVSNGSMRPESEEKFRKITDDILIRANTGMDVGGYREGLFYYGFEKLQKYDEVVLLNYTFFGPLYPFSEMFDNMAKRDLDFWGITNHFQVNPDPYGQNRYGYLPEHLQSHFLVVRKSLLVSKEYKEFIINMKNPASYVDSICDYESVFQKHFLDLGFKGEAYCDSSEYRDYVYNPVMFRLEEMIEKQRCPIVKRRSFFTDYHDFMLNSCGEVTSEAYDYIRKHLNYDMNLVWDNLLRLENMTEISRAMQLNYMLPEKEILQQYCPYKDVAIVIFVHSVKHLDDYEEYFKAIPNEVDTFFICENEMIKNGYLQNIVEKRNNFTLIPNDEEIWFQSFTESLTDKIPKYEYVAVCDVKDYENNAPYSNLISWQYSDWKNVLATSEYIANVITTFEQNERLGMLVPPAPNYGNLFGKMQNGWMGKYSPVAQMLADNQIQVNIKEQDEPLAPFGGTFWIRTKSLKCILEKTWNNVKDNEVALIAMPFLVQNTGYYTGTVYNMEYASIAITNQDYMLRETNKAVFKQFDPSYHKLVVERIKQSSPIVSLTRKGKLKAKVKIYCKNHMSNKTYAIAKRVYFKLKRHA